LGRPTAGAAYAPRVEHGIEQEREMNEHIGLRAFVASEGVHDWRVLSDGAYAFFRTGSLADSARLVAAVAALPEAGPRQPDMDIRGDGVTFRLLTYDESWFGMGRRDADLARAISGIARELGFPPEPAHVQSLLVVPGHPDDVEIFPFWRAVLRYEPRRDSPTEDLVDPAARDASFWFEQMREPRGDGMGSIHVAVFVPEEEAQARIDAALAAGGRIVYDHRPTWVTLADPAGNQADVATTAGRD
jgi:4a-hydroxytetrahydrobiopterin dehydratase